MYRKFTLGICVKSLASLVLAGGLALPVHAEDDTIDPWQGFNRRVFAFNEFIDRYFAKPLARGYTALMPDPLEQGVNNIFTNIMIVPSVVNGVLQWNWSSVGYDSGRFLINSTLGICGLLDIAQYANLPAKDPEDFGQTLAVWGVHSGPYLVLPFYGPSTLRDGFAKPVDWVTDPASYIEDVATYNTVWGLKFVNARAQLLPLEKNLVGDKYTLIRDVYLQRRNYLIHNGEIEDDFGSDDFGDSGF